jgi:hypothetical protein
MAYPVILSEFSHELTLMNSNSEWWMLDARFSMPDRLRFLAIVNRPSSIGRTRLAADQRAFVLKHADAERFPCFAAPAGIHLSFAGCAARGDIFEEITRWRKERPCLGLATN